MWRRLFDGDAQWSAIGMALLPTLLLAWLAARAARRVAAAGLHAIVGETLAPTSPLVSGPLRLVSIATFVLVSSVLLFPAFEIAGLRPRTGRNLREIAAWVFGPGLRVILIAIFGYALCRATALLVKRFEFEVTQGTTLDAIERAKRARTLGSVVYKVATGLIAGISVLMILREFQVDIAPVLTGAGIAGLAVGFGAQTLVRDVISGFFLILEDQVRVGDVAAINGTGGLVEQLNLRTIVLRDIEGTVHVFPNGAIATLANRSKDFSYYVIDLSVSYREDPDRIAAIVREVDVELRQDPRFGPFILEPVEILGVDNFADWSMAMKLRVKTVPLKQWDVGRELRKRLRKALNLNGIEIPYPAINIPKAGTPPPASAPEIPERS
jgi:moderate conductance mechanosensitive channel